MQAFPQSSFFVHIVTVCNYCRKTKSQNQHGDWATCPPYCCSLSVKHDPWFLVGPTLTWWLLQAQKKQNFIGLVTCGSPSMTKHSGYQQSTLRKITFYFPVSKLTLWELWGLFGRSGRIKELTTSNTPFHCYIYLDMNWMWCESPLSIISESQNRHGERTTHPTVAVPYQNHC